MSSSRETPSSCAQIRGWTLDWSTHWCCSWTGSTPRSSATRKPTGSLQIRRDTIPTKHVLTLESAKLNLDSVQVCRNVQWLNSARVSPQFRNLSVPTEVRLAELLTHLHGKGEEACNEFYRGLHIHAEDIYSCLPTRVIQRGKKMCFSGGRLLARTLWGPADSHLNVFLRCNLVQECFAVVER